MGWTACLSQEKSKKSRWIQNFNSCHINKEPIKYNLFRRSLMAVIGDVWVAVQVLKKIRSPKESTVGKWKIGLVWSFLYQNTSEKITDLIALNPDLIKGERLPQFHSPPGWSWVQQSLHWFKAQTNLLTSNMDSWVKKIGSHWPTYFSTQYLNSLMPKVPSACPKRWLQAVVPVAKTHSREHPTASPLKFEGDRNSTSTRAMMQPKCDSCARCSRCARKWREGAHVGRPIRRPPSFPASGSATRSQLEPEKVATSLTSNNCFHFDMIWIMKRSFHKFIFAAANTSQYKTNLKTIQDIIQAQRMVPKWWSVASSWP